MQSNEVMSPVINVVENLQHSWGHLCRNDQPSETLFKKQSLRYCPIRSISFKTSNQQIRKTSFFPLPCIKNHFVQIKTISVKKLGECSVWNGAIEMEWMFNFYMHRKEIQKTWSIIIWWRMWLLVNWTEPWLVLTNFLMSHRCFAWVRDLGDWTFIKAVGEPNKINNLGSNKCWLQAWF